MGAVYIAKFSLRCSLVPLDHSCVSYCFLSPRKHFPIVPGSPESSPSRMLLSLFSLKDAALFNNHSRCFSTSVINKHKFLHKISHKWPGAPSLVKSLLSSETFGPYYLFHSQSSKPQQDRPIKLRLQHTTALQARVSKCFHVPFIKTV